MTKLVTIIKSLTARHIFKECQEVKKWLWGGEFWSDGFFASILGKHSDEATIANYVKNQGSDAKYDRLYNSNQLAIFEWITRYLTACGGVIHFLSHVEQTFEYEWLSFVLFFQSAKDHQTGKQVEFPT